MENIISAHRYGGDLGYVSMPLASFFEGSTATLETEADGDLLVELPWDSDLYIAGLALRSTGWMDGTWVSKSARKGKWRARRYTDSVGELWFGMWDEDGERYTCVLDATGRISRHTTTPSEARVGWVDGSPESFFHSPVERAILRNDREFAVAFTYDSRPYEALFTTSNSGVWRGAWNRPRARSTGACRARVLTDGNDIFFLGEWDEDGYTSSLLGELCYEKRLV